MKTYYSVYPEFVPKQVCETIRQLAQLTPSQDATINSYNSAPSKEYRVSTVRWLNSNNNFLSPFLLWCAVTSNKDYWNFNIDPAITELQYTEYYSSQGGHFDWHDDVLLETNTHRKLSIVLQLSDPSEYTGGNFEMESRFNFNNTEFKKQGSILVFPSFLRHRVTPVTSGTRYSCVSWIHGPEWK